MASTPKLSTSSQDIERVAFDPNVPPLIECISKTYEDLKLGIGIAPEDLALATKDKYAVDFVFEYAKRWCRYIKDLTTTLEKRGNLETEYMRNVGKQFSALLTTLVTMVGVPLKAEVEQMSQQFVDNSKEIEAYNNKRVTALLESLARHRLQFESLRVKRKQEWKVEVKKMVDAEGSLMKSKTSYYQRCQAGVKLREELAAAEAHMNEQSLVMEANASISAITANTSTIPTATASTTSQANQFAKLKAKVEKLEKLLTENDKKELESMYAYRDTVTMANNQLASLEKFKIQLICDIRLSSTTNDEIIRNVLVDYLLQFSSFRQTMYQKYSEIAQSMNSYQPGSGYLSCINDHIKTMSEFSLEKYTFEAFHDSYNSSNTSSSYGTTRTGDTSLNRSYLGPRSTGEISPSEVSSGRCVLSQSDSEEDLDVIQESKESSRTVFSQFFEFGSNLFRPADSKKMSVKKTRSITEVPMVADICNSEKELATTYIVIAKCIKEIEQQDNGITTNGIYRVPAAKSKVAIVMDALNSSPQDADLSDEHPLTLASALKNKLISLPEPLLTWNLYQYFVEVGKEAEATSTVSEEMVKKLKVLVDDMPVSHRIITGLLFHHLRKIANHQGDNQMGSMNLGTMFGPTLLRPRSKFRTTNMMEFVDNKPQTKVVELMIDRVSEIFGPSEEFYNSTHFNNPFSQEGSSPIARSHSVMQESCGETTRITPITATATRIGTTTTVPMKSACTNTIVESTANFTTSPELAFMNCATTARSSVVKYNTDNNSPSGQSRPISGGSGGNNNNNTNSSAAVFHHPIATRPVTFNPTKTTSRVGGAASSLSSNTTTTTTTTMASSTTGSLLSVPPTTTSVSHESLSVSTGNLSSSTQRLTSTVSSDFSSSPVAFRRVATSNTIKDRNASQTSAGQSSASRSTNPDSKRTGIDLEQINFMDTEDYDDGGPKIGGMRDKTHTGTSSSPMKADSSKSSVRTKKYSSASTRDNVKPTSSADPNKRSSLFY